MRRCIAYATDGNTGDICRLVWSIRSLCRNSASQFDVAVMSSANVHMPDSLCDEVAKHGRLLAVADSDTILSGHGFKPDRWSSQWPFQVLYRLTIPISSAFYPYDEVIYLDTDTLVLSPAVDSFIAADISTYEMGGAADDHLERVKRTRYVLDHDVSPRMRAEIVRRYGKDVSERPYVNAGVLKLNLGAVHDDIQWYTERLRYFISARERGLFQFNDQDFINSLVSLYAGFDKRFNAFISGGGEPVNAVIRHYVAHGYADMLKRALYDGLV